MKFDYYQKLFENLPGPIVKIDISSKTPAEIVDQFDQLVKTKIVPSNSTICLTNGDVWRYSDQSEIFNHVLLQNKSVFNVTLGYENKKISHNCWQLVYPWVYFSVIKKNAPGVLKTNCTHGFSCLNNIPSVHRLVLGYNFFKNNLLDNIIFSQNDNPWTTGWKDLNLLDQLDDFNSYQKLLPITHQEAHKNYWILALDHTVKHAAYTDAFCNIVTESTIESGLQLISEKSFKPFIAAQIPLFYACIGHLPYLTDLGFEVMENVIPGGYDHLGMDERIQKIIWLVKQGKRYIEDFYAQHTREIQHNLELVYSSNVEKKILSNIHNVISI